MGESEDLYFVTGDKDYLSLIDKNAFDPYLATEWNRKKKSRVLFYRQLSDFFKTNFPDIELADEYDKYKTIEALVNSNSFQATHHAVARLSSYTTFTPDEVNRIIEAAITNNQILWIATDHDVSSTLRKIFKSNESVVEEGTRDQFMKQYYEDSYNHDDDLPF